MWLRRGVRRWFGAGRRYLLGSVVVVMLATAMLPLAPPTAVAAVDGWSRPVHISDTPPSFASVLTRGPKGGLTVAYVGPDTRVMAARRPPRGSWSTSVPISPRDSGIATFGGAGLDLDAGPDGSTFATWVRNRVFGERTFVEVARYRRTAGWSRPTPVAATRDLALGSVEVVVGGGGVFVLWIQNESIRLSRLTDHGWSTARTIVQRRVTSFSAAAADGPLTVVFTTRAVARISAGVGTVRVRRDGRVSRIVRLSKTSTRRPAAFTSRAGVVTLAWADDYQTQGCLFVARRRPGSPWSRVGCLRFDLDDAYQFGGFQSEWDKVDIAGNARGDVAVTFTLFDDTDPHTPGDREPPKAMLARTRGDGTWSLLLSRTGHSSLVAMAPDRKLAFLWQPEGTSLQVAWKPMGRAWTHATAVNQPQPGWAVQATGLEIRDRTTVVWEGFDQQESRALPLLAARHR